MTGFLKGFKDTQRIQRERAEELEQFKNDHAEVVRLLLEDHKAEINTYSNEIHAIKRNADKDTRILQEKLEESEGKLKAQLSEKDRMEKLLTKVSKRAATYRTMMEAVAAWEEEIAVEREEDKLEKFLEWKNSL